MIWSAIRQSVPDRPSLQCALIAFQKSHFIISNIANSLEPISKLRRRRSRYMRRRPVERFFAWIQWQRRILVRWEYHSQNFLGFVQLACLVILFKRF